MLVDGKKIADEIKGEIRESLRKHGARKLVAIQVGENAVSESFLAIKKKFGEEVGIPVHVERMPEHISTEALAIHVQYFAAQGKTSGIIVQLPLPAHIVSETVLNKIPTEKDPDVLSAHSRKLFEEGKLPVLPPVVGAVKEILERYAVDLANKRIVIVGQGSLVGRPTRTWFAHAGLSPELITRETTNSGDILRTADIIISGAGSAGVITPEVIKNGVVIIDAGTSDVGELTSRRIAGDALPECATKAALFTPVPGGVGPVAVAMLFKNLISLSS